MNPKQDAVVIIYEDGGAMVRPALFVFSTPRGFAWVEPSYRDPYRVHSGMHQAEGSITLAAKGFACNDGDRLLVVTDAPEAPDDNSRQLIAWAHDDIKKSGQTVEGERERLRQVIADAVAETG